MLFSLIIPVWNVEKYLPDCFNSLLQQSETDFEVIFVDDGSPDRSAEFIATQIASQRLANFHLLRQANAGAGAARNNGLAAAKGDYVLFVDSDDLLPADALANYKKAVESYPEAVVFYSNFYILASSGPAATAVPTATAAQADSKRLGQSANQEVRKLQPFNLNLPLHQLRGEPQPLPLQAVAPWNKLISRAYLLKHPDIRFPHGLWYEDLEFCLRLQMYAPLWVALPDYNYIYRLRPESAMSSKRLERNRDILTILDRCRTAYAEAGLSDKYRSELEAVTAYHGYLSVLTRLYRASADVAVATFEIPLYRNYKKINCPNYLHNSLLSWRQKLLGLLYDLRCGRLLRFFHLI
ncbi:glycosyltransferase family 2 protein [Mageeibacillus indolicus]|uniref:glycosyltransferase family 2 protein n=1 Tax=Mageeibacillus indolicus TaxID=884684 RepID=UPI0004DD193A|nr:glycosyltransferase family A protein [Mageeibacillus indolicus]KFA57738.1 hypothetical protein HMPREF1632_01505 [Mageeibacillus indolicus 0009-5]